MSLEAYWPVLSFLIVQTLAAVWWAASMSSSVKNMKEDITEIKDNVREAYPQRDGARLEVKVDHIERHLFHGT